jgi:hypothetical protein
LDWALSRSGVWKIGQRCSLADPARENAMGSIGTDHSSAGSVGEGGVRAVAAARQALATARADLDAAVVALPEVDGDEGMATPGLVALLIRAVAAKDRLDELESSEREAPDADASQPLRPGTI